MDDPVWDATVFTKNREGLRAGDAARAFLAHVVAEARAQHLWKLPTWAPRSA